MDSVFTVMNLSGGTFYLDFEEVIHAKITGTLVHCGVRTSPLALNAVSATIPSPISPAEGRRYPARCKTYGAASSGRH